jgi:hypothetical protein
MKLTVMCLACTFLFVVSPARAEVSEIENPSWQEVPNTDTPGNNEQYDSPAYVDINGIIRDADIVIFDMIESNVNYVRVEANCRTRKFRTLRQGFFESSTRINYVNQTSPWTQAESAYNRASLTFVCSQN